MQASQKGVIGVTLVSHWFLPISEAKHQKNAALRSLDFMFGWYRSIQFSVIFFNSLIIAKKVNTNLLVV